MELTTQLAEDLKKAGLKWEPANHDFFMIPDTALSDRKFVLTDMMANIAVLKGWPAITFNGSVEWALDYIFIVEAVWLPTEAQLRGLLEKYLPAYDSFLLRRNKDGYQCEVNVAEEPLVYNGKSASDAYAAALIAWLKSANSAEKE